MKKTVFTLNIDNYAPEITELTYPLIKYWTNKIGADFYCITERKFPEYPVTYEKLQIYNLGKEMKNDWNIYVDSDALVHPETIDWTVYLNKDTVAHNGNDMANIRWRYDNYFLRDGRNIGSCFPSQTPIIGEESYIEDIKTGSLVLSNDGRIQKVTQIFKKKYFGKMVTLKCACIPPIEMTEEHPVLVSNCTYKYHYTKNSITGKRKCHRARLFSKPKWKNAKDIISSDYVLIPRIKINEIQKIEFMKGKEKISLAIDEDIAWLLGLYVAEGFYSEKLRMSINKTEENLAEKAVKVFKKIGIASRISRTPSKIARGVIEVIAYNKSLCKIFDSWCGHGAINKKVPLCIMQSPENVIRAFIRGLMDGDGCLYKGYGLGGFRLVSISRKLIFDMICLCHKIGVNVSSYAPRKIENSIIEGRKVNTKPIYELNIPLTSLYNIPDKQGCINKGHAYFTKDYIYIPVRQKNISEESELTVYNFETEDHTYCVPFVVHNCNWMTLASDWCIDLWSELDISLDEAISNIFPTVEESNTVITPEHLIDDYTLSRNIAKYGLKFTTLIHLQKDIGLEDANFFWHVYTVPIEEKIIRMKEVLTNWKIPEFIRTYGQ